jgi:uncharacterized protein
MTTPRIDIPMDRLVELCKRWKIVELSLFGSVLRDDFTPESDVDVLLVFADGFRPGIDEYIGMQSDFENLFSRSVDLVNRKYLRNPFLLNEILNTREVILAA